MFILGLSALIGVAISAPYRLTPQEAEFRRYLVTLRHDLNQEAVDGDVLVQHADNLLLRVADFPHRAGEAHFLAGSAYGRHAEQKPGKDRWARAVENLEKARALGIADADQPALLYRLGHALYRQDKELPRAIELMTTSIEKGTPRPIDGYRILIEANLNLPTPNIDAAASAARRMLELIPAKQVETAAQMRLQYADLLMRKGRRADAIRELEQVSSKAPIALRVKARLAQARACEAEGAWSEAVPIWTELLKDAPQIPGGRAFIYYRLGWCYHEMKPAKYEDNIRAWSEALKLGGDAGQAAGVHLGELRMALGGEQITLALNDWRQAFKDVRSVDDFKNPLVEAAQVRALFDQTMNTFKEMQDPDKTRTVAELYRRITPGGVADLRLAQAEEAYAKHLADKRKQHPAAANEADVLAQYRRAGEAFENAAQAQTEKERPDPLWRGIQAHLNGRNAPRAQQLLTQYVQLETNEERLAEAWFTIGDLYQQAGQKQNAYQAFIKCSEYPNTPFQARSSYYLAEEEIAKKNSARAEEILTTLVAGASNQIEPHVREKSYFRLASLLLSQEQYAKAHFYLKECLTLYPANANAYVVREQLGECCRQLAKAEMEHEKALAVGRSKTPAEAQMLEERRRHHQQKRGNWLKEAERYYFELADKLQKQAPPLSPLEQTLLRRAWFGMGDCVLDNEKYERALEIFADLQKKHRRTLEGLYACSRLVDTVGMMMPASNAVANLREQAIVSVKMLQEDLAALPKDHEMFRLQRVPTREAWLDWADKTQKRLQAPPSNDKGPAIR
jgi:TolA-binding protein